MNPCKHLTLLAFSQIALTTTVVAADVTISGYVDLGFSFNNIERTGQSAQHKFSMDSGSHNGSRFIFKGSEDLGNGYRAVFHLENAFSADTGTLGQGGRLFGRESRLSLETPYGTISMGRMGALTAGMGTYDIFQWLGDTFDGGWNYAVNINNWFERARYDNMLTLVTPTYAGLTGYFQYSFGTDSVSNDGANDDALAGERTKTRYAATGLKYQNGKLDAALVFDSVMRKRWAVDGSRVNPDPEDPVGRELDDAYAISLALGYDFEVAKLTFAAQYGFNESGNFSVDYGRMKDSKGGDATGDGFTLGMGINVPTHFGNILAAAYYGQMRLNDANDEKYRNMNFITAYEYPLSKRTRFYTALAYKDIRAEDDSGSAYHKEKFFTAMTGIAHRF